MLEPTSGYFGLGIAVFWFIAASRSKTVRSMTVLLWFSEFFLGEGVGESEITIGLDGVLGGVVSGEDGS